MLAQVEGGQGQADRGDDAQRPVDHTDGRDRVVRRERGTDLHEVIEEFACASVVATRHVRPARANALAGEASTMAVLPVRNRVMGRGVEPHIVMVVRGHISVGIHLLHLPTAAGDFVFHAGTGLSLDGCAMKNPVELEWKRLGGIPLAQRWLVAGDINGPGGAVDGGNDAESDPTHD